MCKGHLFGGILLGAILIVFSVLSMNSEVLSWLIFVIGILVVIKSIIMRIFSKNCGCGCGEPEKPKKKPTKKKK